VATCNGPSEPEAQRLPLDARHLGAARMMTEVLHQVVGLGQHPV
jgi:hypothetical protein